MVQVHLARRCRPCRCRSPRCPRRSARSSGRRAWPDRAGRRRPRRAARRWRRPTLTGSVASRPSLCSVCSTSMNSSPRPYLKVTRLALTQRGISSTSSCSTLTHSTGPMPAGKSKVSGSLNGGVVNQPRSSLPDHRRVEALLDRGPDRERRREVVAGDGEVGAVAHADLVDLAEQLVGRVPGEHVGQAGLDADADQGQLARLLPLVGHGELLVAELDAGLGVGLVRMRMRQRHRHVEVVSPRPASAARKSGMTNRGSAAFIRTSQRCSASRAAVAASSLASSCTRSVRVPGGRRALRPGQVIVCDDQLSKWPAGSDPGDRGSDSAGSDKEYAHACDPSPGPRDGLHGTSRGLCTIQLN